MFEQHVFICGLHRSGTTMLEHWLHANADVAVLRAEVPENEGQHLQDVYPRAAEYGGPGRFAFAPEMYPVAPSTDRAGEMRGRLLACWTPWLHGDSTTLLEKSPPNLTKIPWLRGVFPGAGFVIMTRDPRAVAAATQKWSGNSYEELIYHWHVAHGRALRDSGSDCVWVRYEDFCVDPAGTADEVLTRLKLRPRVSPLPLERRFEKPSDANSRYLARVPRRMLGDGIWEKFGYRLD